MPAVTVDDPTTLPRLTEPGLGDQARPVWQVTTAPSGYEGEGFPVRRAFAGIDMALLDPFIMMDQMGEVEYAPGEPKGTAWRILGTGRSDPRWAPYLAAYGGEVAIATA